MINICLLIFSNALDFNSQLKNILIIAGLATVGLIVIGIIVKGIKSSRPNTPKETDNLHTQSIAVEPPKEIEPIMEEEAEPIIKEEPEPIIEEESEPIVEEEPEPIIEEEPEPIIEEESEPIIEEVKVKKDSGQDKSPASKPAKKPTKKYFGKFEINVTVVGYHFYLLANNGQLLYASSSFTTPEGAKKGIDTFKKAVEQDNFVVDEDKFGRFRFILNRRYAGENFTTRVACERNIESVKRFAMSAMIMDYEPNPEAEEEYLNLKSKMQVKDCDWDKIQEEEAKVKPSGKFEISEHVDGFRYELIANNGQLLYSSNGYASHKSAKAAITNFKKSVYCGTFLIDEDKFGRFRYVIRGANVMATYIGESYTTRAQCERSINSVKNFVKSAVMPE